MVQHVKIIFPDSINIMKNFGRQTMLKGKVSRKEAENEDYGPTSSSQILTEVTTALSFFKCLFPKEKGYSLYISRYKGTN